MSIFIQICQYLIIGMIKENTITNKVHTKSEVMKKQEIIVDNEKYLRMKKFTRKNNNFNHLSPKALASPKNKTMDDGFPHSYIKMNSSKQSVQEKQISPQRKESEKRFLKQEKIQRSSLPIGMKSFLKQEKEGGKYKQRQFRQELFEKNKQEKYEKVMKQNLQLKKNLKNKQHEVESLKEKLNQMAKVSQTQIKRLKRKILTLQKEKDDKEEKIKSLNEKISNLVAKQENKKDANIIFQKDLQIYRLNKIIQQLNVQQTCRQKIYEEQKKRMKTQMHQTASYFKKNNGRLKTSLKAHEIPKKHIQRQVRLSISSQQNQ